MTTINASNHPKSVTLQPSEPFVVELQETPTSGYRWKLSKTEVKLLADDFHQAADTGIGGGGLHRFECQAPAMPGSYELELQLCRPWDTADVVDHFKVELVVQD